MNTLEWDQNLLIKHNKVNMKWKHGFSVNSIFKYFFIGVDVLFKHASKGEQTKKNEKRWKAEAYPVFAL